VICANCGTENRLGAKFCSECATPFGVVCPNCGTSNNAGAKFCTECATPLQAGAVAARSAGGVATGGTAGALAGLVGGAQASNGAGTGAAAMAGAATAGSGAGPVSERRLVSVLFADLVGWTPFAADKDAEEVRETLTRYFDMAREVIGRYGGTVEKFIGDAVMAVWGAPVAQEDDAERAVRAALDLVDAVRALGPGIQARAGVLTGEAAVTIGATNQGMVAGDIVNTASRLQSAAQPGSVLVGEATQRSASGAIVFEAAGEQTLKGKVAPVPAWRAVRVVAERGGRGRSESLEAPFVGRDEELRQLKDLHHAAERERKPRLVSVIGPAGIGKHRLAWEFLKYLDGLADLVYWHAGRSPAYGDGITFWALGEMVRARAGLRELDDEATSRAKIGAIVGQFVPDPDEREWIEPALLALLGLKTGIGSEQLFAAWRTFFERLAQAAPVILVFEDLHHADGGTLDFIDHLMEWSRGVPITVLTLARPELLERRPDWGAGKRTFAGIHLEPLPPPVMRELLDGLAPGLPPSAVDAIVGRADGVPLYAVETVRMLVAQGRVRLEGERYVPVGDLGDLDALAVPETLTALIAARLDALDAGDRKLIEDASVLGQSFTLSGLSAVSGVEKVDLEPRLRDLVRRELLVLNADPRSPERGQYAFVQALTREVAYNTLAKKDRKVRHLAAARFFESLETDELAGGLAGHYLAAQRLASDPDEAAALAVQARIALRGAAERAAALGSFAQALAFAEQAIGVTTDQAELAELHRRATVFATEGAANPDIAVGHAQAVVDIVRPLGDRPVIATALARLSEVVTRYAVDPSRGLKMAEAAWSEFADLEDTPAGVRLMQALSWGNALQGDSPDQLVWCERILPVTERLDLPSELVSALIGRGSGLVKIDRVREGLVEIRGGHQLALELGLPDEEFRGRILLTFWEQWNDPAAGLALAREGLEIARRRGSRTYTLGMIGNGSVCAIRVGDWEWAAAQLSAGLGGEGPLSFDAELLADRAMLRSLRGEDPEGDLAAARTARATITDPQYEAYDEWARAWRALASGDPAGTIRHAEGAAEKASFFRALTWPIAGRAAIWAGDAGEARRFRDLLDSTPLRGTTLDHDRSAIRAGVAALEGRPAEAADLYVEALRGFKDQGVVFDFALGALDVATVLADADRGPDVVAAIETARATFARLGAQPFANRLEAALANPASRARQPSVAASATTERAAPASAG
jgi:class 3 adenylate cyclase